jgi:hypothetical protein
VRRDEECGLIAKHRSGNALIKIANPNPYWLHEYKIKTKFPKEVGSLCIDGLQSVTYNQKGFS